MSESFAGAADGSFEGDDLPVNTTLRRIVLIFRLLGWAWMLMLVVLTLVFDEEADSRIAIAALAAATGWTVLTLWASRSHERLTDLRFVVVDLILVLVVFSASDIAGAEHFFHGGYPMTWVVVAAYAWGLKGAAYGSLFLVVEQVVIDLAGDRGEIPAAGSITFFVFAVVVGWAFEALRDREKERLATARALRAEQERLAEEQRQRARYEERVDLANRLHDSVLQTLVVMRRDAADARQVRYLARRQDWELRWTIDEYRSPFENSLRAALLAVCGEIEDLYRVEVDAVIRGDADAGGPFEAAVAAAHEALVNAAKHSGQLTIDLYAELSGAAVEIYVRDTGVGFDMSLDPSGHGLKGSLLERVAAVGGTATVSSEAGEGTEVAISIGRSQ